MLRTKAARAGCCHHKARVRARPRVLRDQVRHALRGQRDDHPREREREPQLGADEPAEFPYDAERAAAEHHAEDEKGMRPLTEPRRAAALHHIFFGLLGAPCKVYVLLARRMPPTLTCPRGRGPTPRLRPHAPPVADARARAAGAQHLHVLCRTHARTDALAQSKSNYCDQNPNCEIKLSFTTRKFNVRR